MKITVQNKLCTTIQQEDGFDIHLQLGTTTFRAKIGHFYDPGCLFSKLSRFRLEYWVKIPTGAEIFSSLLWSE